MEEGDSLEEKLPKKVRFLEKLFLAWSKRPGAGRFELGQIIPGMDVHTTFTFTDDGYVEIHGTGRIPGGTKKHISVAKVKWEDFTRIVQSEAHKISRPLDVNDPSLKKSRILIPKSGVPEEELLSFVKRQGRVATISEKEGEELRRKAEEIYRIVKPIEVGAYEFDEAWMANQQLSHAIGVIKKTDKGIRLFPLNSLLTKKFAEHVIKRLRKKSV